MNEQLTQLYGYLHGMWGYRWSALIIAWIVALLGWLAVLAIPDKFSVKTVVYVDTSSVLKPLLAGLTPETDSQDELAIMTRTLLSRNNLMSVIRETDMDLDANSIEGKEQLLKQLAKKIKIIGGGNGKSRDKKSNVYEISYTSNSANRSYQVVSNLLNTMIEDTLNSTRTDAVSAQKFLDSQILVYEERLSVSEQKLAKFKKDNVGYMPDERGGYYSRLQRAQDTVGETAFALLLAERRYSELSKQLNNENPILRRDGYQSESAKKISEYQSQLNLLLKKYTNVHPEVIELKAAIEDLKSVSGANEASPDGIFSRDELNDLNPVYQEVKVELSKASVEIETLKIQLSEQNIYVDRLRESIDIIPEVEARLAKLNRGYEVTRERYLNLMERSEASKLSQSVGQSSSDVSFRVIEPPIVPFEASGPNRILLLSGVLLSALGVGCVWGAGRYMLEPTFIGLKQVVSVTGFPVLGTVNLYLSSKHRRKRRFQLVFFTSAIFLLVIVFGIVFLWRDSMAALLASVISGKYI